MLEKIAAYVTADTSQYESRMASVVSTAGRVKSALVGLGVTLLGGATIKAAVHAWMEQEDALKMTEAALIGVGASVDKYLPKLNKLAGQIEAVTTLSDESVLSAATFGLNMGISTDKIEKATIAAAGLAAKYRLDVNMAMRLVGMAMRGNTQILSRYGIFIQKNLSPQEKFNELMRQGAKAFDIAKLQATTLSGKLTIMRHEWSNVLEPVGQIVVALFHFAPIVDYLAKTFMRWGEALQEVIKQGQTQNFGPMFIALLTVEQMAIRAKFAFLTFFELMTGGFHNLIGSITNFGDMWGQMTKWLGEAWFSIFDSIYQYFTTVFSNIWDNAKGIVEYLKSFGTTGFDWKPLTQGLSKLQIDPFKLDESKFAKMRDVMGNIVTLDGEKEAALAASLAAATKPMMDKVTSAAQSAGRILSGPNAARVGAAERGSLEAYRMELGKPDAMNAVKDNTKAAADIAKQQLAEQRKMNQSLIMFTPPQVVTIQ